MAYKFQLGSATMSGSLTQEGDLLILDDAGVEKGVFDKAGVLSSSGGASAASFSSDGAGTFGSVVVGSADMSEADLEKLDGITNGAGAANKALVLNASAVIASGLVGLTASSGIKAGEVEATGHVIAPALISTNIVSGSGQGSFESLRLGGGTATVSNLGAAVFGGSVTAASSFVIGSADLNETDLEKLDGITNGTAAANKALVADGNIDISGLRNLTATGVISAAGITLGSAVLVEAELEMLDGITAGTAAASKALVADSNIDITGLRNITGTGAITAGTSFVIGSADLNEADMEKLDGITNGAGAANKALVLNAGSSIASGLVSITASADVKAAVFEATGEFKIGNARIAEAELEMLDGITAGTAQPQKAVVLSANSDIVGINALTASGIVGTAIRGGTLSASAGVSGASWSSDGAVTAGTSFIIGSADLNETDLEKLDGITNGTVAANKAVVADANKDVGTLRNVTLNGALNTATLSASGDAGAERFYAGGPNFGAASFKVDGAGVVSTNAILGTSFSGSSFVSASHLSINNNNAKIAANGDATFAAATLAATTTTTLSASSTLKVAGTVQFDGAVDTAFTAADSLYFLDADGLMKRDSFTDVMEIAAGTVAATGIENTSGVLSLSIHGLGAETIATGDKLAFSDSGDNGLHHETIDDLFSIGPALVAAASIDVAADHFLFLDGGASGAAKKESIADLVAGMAGAGLGSSAGQLSVQGATVTAATDTVVLTEGYNFFTGSATAVCSLPDASVGDVVTVKAADTAFGNSITISRSGSQTIDGATSLVLESPFAAVTMVYVANNDWRIV